MNLLKIFDKYIAAYTECFSKPEAFKDALIKSGESLIELFSKTILNSSNNKYNELCFVKCIEENKTPSI